MRSVLRTPQEMSFPSLPVRSVLVTLHSNYSADFERSNRRREPLPRHPEYHRNRAHRVPPSIRLK